jgi:hypothetical protein
MFGRKKGRWLVYTLFECVGGGWWVCFALHGLHLELGGSCAYVDVVLRESEKGKNNHRHVYLGIIAFV